MDDMRDFFLFFFRRLEHGVQPEIPPSHPPRQSLCRLLLASLGSSRLFDLARPGSDSNRKWRPSVWVPYPAASENSLARAFCRWFRFGDLVLLLNGSGSADVFYVFMYCYRGNIVLKRQPRAEVLWQGRDPLLWLPTVTNWLLMDSCSRARAQCRSELIPPQIRLIIYPKTSGGSGTLVGERS